MKAAKGKTNVSESKAKLATLSQWHLIRRKFVRHRVATASFFLLLVLYIVAVFGEFFAPYPPQWRSLDHAYCPPQPARFSFSKGLHVYALKRHVDPITFRKTYVEDYDDIIPLQFFVKGEPYKLWRLIPWDRHLLSVDINAYQLPENASVDSPSEGAKPVVYFLGADKYGQDILSRMVYGARISLSVGLIGIAITFVLGLTIGGVSGYVGGALDNFIQRVIEIFQSFPQLPLWLALAAAMPDDWSPLRVYFAITLVLSLLNWPRLARIVRGKILALREEDYAMAARLMGASHRRIIFRHLIPGFTSHIIVALTLSLPRMILGETSLSFLGLGLRPPIVSWGVMIQDCTNMTAIANYPWLMMPVGFIVLTVLSFNFLGDGLRDAADPYAVN